MRRKHTTRSPSSPACSVWRARATTPGPAAHHPTGRVGCAARRTDPPDPRAQPWYLRRPTHPRRVAPGPGRPCQPQTRRPHHVRARPARRPPSAAWWADPAGSRRDAGTRSRPAPVRTARSDQLWVADITQQRTDQGWLYLAVVLDAFSRRVVGWSMADHLRTELVLDALEMAISQRQPPPGLVCHSDHGCQYTSFAYGRRLHASGLVASMGTVGDALDNAVAESFFATLECELLDRYPWPTRAGLRTAIFDFIEVFYNRQRRHSTLDYASPVSYEQQHVPVSTVA